jgi:hypothetical protein
VALTGAGETADLVATHGLGTVATPQDVTAIAKAIERALAMQPLNHGAWDRALGRYDGRSLTERFARILDRQCRGSKAAANPWIAS